jgi:hypothetical protein
VLEEVQTALREHAVDIEFRVAVELHYAQLWCLEALVKLEGPKAAKEIQVRCGRRAPLTICVGTGFGKKPVLIHRQELDGTLRIERHRVPAEGCYGVFPDNPLISGGRRRWARMCPGCRNNNKRNPRRTSARKWQRHLEHADAVRANHGLGLAHSPNCVDLLAS